MPTIPALEPPTSGNCVQCRIPLRYHGRRKSASGLWFEPVPFAEWGPNGAHNSNGATAGRLNTLLSSDLVSTGPKGSLEGTSSLDVPALLPFELSTLVFTHLLPPSGRGDSLHTLLEGGLVSREWYRRTRDDGIWREACRRVYLASDLTSAPFLLSPPMPISYLAKKYPARTPEELKLVQHFERRAYLHPLGHYAALSPGVRRGLTEEEAKRIVRARIWAGWAPDAFPPFVPEDSSASMSTSEAANSTCISQPTLALLHASHAPHTSPLPPCLTTSFPSMYLLSYATHIRSQHIPFLPLLTLSRLNWTFSFRNPVWWRLGEAEARSWAVFTAEGGYRSGMFEEEVELRWRFLGDDEGEYEDDAGYKESAVPGSKQPWGHEHADSHWTGTEPGSISRFLASSRAVKALMSLGSLLLTGKARLDGTPGRRWIGRRRRWVQVERYPPLEVSRNKEGGWRMANAYVIFDSVDASKLAPSPTPPAPTLLPPSTSTQTLAPTTLLPTDEPPPPLFPKPEPRYVFWDEREEERWKELEAEGDAWVAAKSGENGKEKRD